MTSQSNGLLVDRLHTKLDTRVFGWRDAAVILLVALVAYGTQFLLPAFNQDDIIQLQPISGDGAGYMQQGRWGYYLIATVLLEMNPAGLLPAVLSVVIVTLSSWLSAIVVGLRTYTAIVTFSLVATISLYYGLLFSFDSARLVVALGTLCAAAGTYLVVRRQFAWAAAVLVLAPAFYSPAIELAACLGVASAIGILLRGRTRDVLRRLAAMAAVLLVAMVFFYASTFVASWLSGIPLNGRSAIRISEAWSNLAGIVRFFLTYSLPFMPHESPYFTSVMRFCVVAAMILFGIAAIASVTQSTRRSPALDVALLLALSVALVVAPYGLAFATPIEQFAARSVYSFATVHAAMLGMAIEAFRTMDRRYWKSIAVVPAAVGLLLATESALSVSKMAYDEYLASQSDLAAVNRIISRIDTVLATQPVADPVRIPIAVRAEHPFRAGPRGAVESARWVSWSREWIFRFVDNRFIPAENDARQAGYKAAETHGAWPAADSVFVHDGVVVVRID